MIAAASLLIASAAFGQAVLKVNDNVNLKFGVLLQTQGDATQDATTRLYAQNVFVRRARVLLAGQITPNLTFFAETDSPNLFKSTTAGTKNNASTIILQDAYVNYKFNDAFSLDAGLMLVAPSRNGLQSAASLLPVDYGAHTFANSAALQNSAGRDTGIQARGYLVSKKLEYRVGVFQGMRDQLNRELRSAVRVQYNVFDPETSFFYTGTYLGKKKILAIGAGVDHQHKYDAHSADIFFDWPLATGAVTAQFDHIRYNGSTFLKSLADQQDTLFEAGFLIGKTRLMPVVQIAERNFSASTGIDEKRYGAGVNYFLNGHNANFKALFVRSDLKGGKTANQFTVQLQFFYF
jgi:hypothetical protein